MVEASARSLLPGEVIFTIESRLPRVGIGNKDAYPCPGKTNNIVERVIGELEALANNALSRITHLIGIGQECARATLPDTRQPLDDDRLS